MEKSPLLTDGFSDQFQHLEMFLQTGTAEILKFYSPFLFLVLLMIHPPTFKQYEEDMVLSGKRS